MKSVEEALDFLQDAYIKAINHTEQLQDEEKFLNGYTCLIRRKSNVKKIILTVKRKKGDTMKTDMRKVYKIRRTIIVCFLVVILCIPTDVQVKATSSKDVNEKFMLTNTELTVYVGWEVDYRGAILSGQSRKVKHTIKSSDESIVKVNGDNIVGIKEGTANVKLYAAKLKKTLTCKVTVKYAELVSNVGPNGYVGNTYNFWMLGNTFGTQYTSSNEKIATVDEAGVVKTIKEGKVTISCVGLDGKTYRSTLNVKKPGLNYTKLTTYYYTGNPEGSYLRIGLVAYGIQVKKFTSSDKKVAIVDKYGVISSTGVGKCTITCTDKNGKTYKCALTVEGGKKWGGLNGGYSITKSELKKTELYKRLNKVYDYGNAISIAYSYNKKTGNLDFKDKVEVAREINLFSYYNCLLRDRFFNQKVRTICNDFLIVKNDDGSDYRVIRVITLYIE